MTAQDRKTKILNATQDLLLEKGGADLTMRKVAARVGISLGNVQYHFATRNDLLLALLLRFLEPYEARLQGQTTHLPSDAAHRMEQAFLSALTDPDFDACATLYKELWAASNHSPDIRDALTAYYDRLADFQRRALSEATGLPVSDPRIERATLVILPMLEGFCITKDTVKIPLAQLAAEWAGAIMAIITTDLD